MKKKSNFKKFFLILSCFAIALVSVFSFNFTNTLIASASSTATKSSQSFEYNFNGITTDWYYGRFSGQPSNFTGRNVWTDGVNTYYSNGTNHYVLDKYLNTWSSKSWSGLSEFYGSQIWSDGINIYYSYRGTNRILNGNTWSSITFTFDVPLDSRSYFDGQNVFSFGSNTYYFDYYNSYVFDGSTGWSIWRGGLGSAIGTPVANFDVSQVIGQNVWTDGVNTYFSYSYSRTNSSTVYYVTEKINDNGTVEDVSFSGFTNLLGKYIWTDGALVYYSYNGNNYFFNLNTLSFDIINFNIVNDSDFTLNGDFIWTDGTIIYYSGYFNSSVYNRSFYGGIYNSGYKIGYDAGYNAGYDAGYNAGLNEGSTSDSYSAGYNAGYNAGIATNSGYSDGYNVGYNQGYNVGYSAGEQVGYSAGNSAGYDIGYDVGYDDGLEDSGEYSFLSLISATIDAPIRAFTGLFNFEIFDVNIKNLLLALFTASVIIVIVKLCLGGGK